MAALKGKPTPTQQKMLDLLSDGMPHSREEMFACLWDEESRYVAIHPHISLIRKLLPPGEAIICEYRKRSIYYRHVRLLTPNSKY